MGGLEFSVKLVLLFATYVVTARLGLSLDAVSGFAALVWPPTGIALAAMILLGYRYWPAIAAGAFLVNFVTGASWFVALGISVGNTLEAVLGAYLLKHFTTFLPSLERLKDVLWLIFFGAVASTLVSATIGVSSLALGGELSSSYGETWIAWWIGDVLGALVVAPLLLVWGGRVWHAVAGKQFIAAIIPFGLLVAASIFVFFGLPMLGVRPFSFAYVLFPLLIWIVLRFRQAGCVVATFVVSLVAIWAAVVTNGATEGVALSRSLLLLQCFIGVTAATFMIMAAVVAEREQTQKKQQHLTQKTRLLSRQRLRLQALNKAKDDFISIASHQLRTPATGVKQYLGMLLESYAGKLTAKQRTYATVAYENNERQLRIINDLLRVANLDANNLRLQKTKCNIVALLADIVRDQSIQLEKRRQSLEFRSARRRIEVHIDKEFLRMVIESILDNAARYTPEGGNISIQVAPIDGQVRLQITDTGVGIAKKDQHKLFQKFSSIGESQAGGSGLGLYWAKRVVDLHGGKIKLSSESNKGTTFVISLPASVAKKLQPKDNLGH